MPHFSATAAALAHEPWTVEIEGRTHTARPVSRPALLTFWAAVTQAGDNAAAQEVALRRLLRVAFPARWRYVIQPQRDPVNRLLDLGIEDRKEALDSFFAALSPAPAPGPTMTPGPSEKLPSSVAATP